MAIRLTPSNSGRNYVGIVAQQQRMIGLFEILRIQQCVNGSTQTVVWIRSVRSPFSAWVRPHAILEDDPYIFGVDNNHIELLCEGHLRLNAEGRIYQNSVMYASLTRIPYNVSFWEQEDIYPVYTLFPDYRLPWSHTIRSSYNLPFQNPVVQTSIMPSPQRVRPRSLSVDAICPITFEPLTNETAYWTPCAHAFSHAIFRALAHDARCPMCRTPCTDEQITHL